MSVEVKSQTPSAAADASNRASQPLSSPRAAMSLDRELVLVLQRSRAEAASTAAWRQATAETLRKLADAVLKGEEDAFSGQGARKVTRGYDPNFGIPLNFVEIVSLCSPSVVDSIDRYIDGCYDIMHSGHYNAIRQAKQLCDVLVVGVHSDKEIGINKVVFLGSETKRRRTTYISMRARTRTTTNKTTRNHLVSPLFANPYV